MKQKFSRKVGKDLTIVYQTRLYSLRAIEGIRAGDTVAFSPAEQPSSEIALLHQGNSLTLSPVQLDRYGQRMDAQVIGGAI